MKKTSILRACYFCLTLTFMFAFPFAIATCNAETRQPSVTVTRTAISVMDFHQGMVITTIDANAIRRTGVQRLETCLGETPDCFGAAAALLPTGSGNLIVSTALAYENDQTKFNAQQFNLHFQTNFTFTGALDGPVTSVVHPNCYYLYGEDSKTSLTHVKYRGGNDIQVVGNFYHTNNATTGPTKKYFPKVDYHHFTGCFGTDLKRSEIISDDLNHFALNYKGKDNVLRTLSLPEFVPGALILSADMTSRYDSIHASLEFVIVSVGWQQPSGGYQSQVFLQPVDVSQPQWQLAGNPISLTKAKSDQQIQSRLIHSVSIDPLGNFAVYAIPYRSSGVVKGQRLNPDTGEKIGRSHTIFKSSLFGKEHGPYGLSISYIF